jgi:hypothetical protein
MQSAGTRACKQITYKKWVNYLYSDKEQRGFLELIDAHCGPPQPNTPWLWEWVVWVTACTSHTGDLKHAEQNQILYNHLLELVITLTCLLPTCGEGKAQSMQVIFPQDSGEPLAWSNPIKKVADKSAWLWIANSDTDVTPRACTAPNFHVRNSQHPKASTW